MLVTLDVKNAFNTASWSIINRELKNKHISTYLINVISSYLTGRKITMEGMEWNTTAGVPQGSVLGPTLWNILYDEVLRLDFPAGVQCIGFADDLALVVTAEEDTALARKAKVSIDMVGAWLRDHYLEMAPEKTEAVILRGPRKRDRIKFTVQENEIVPTKAIRYLGIMVDSQGTFGAHIQRVVKKAESRAAALLRIMPNIGGPSSSKRAVLIGVVHSILLYGAPVWHRVLRINRYKMMLQRIQRKMLLRVASAYRTTSARALQTITGIPPIELLIEERRFIFENTEGIEEHVARAQRARDITIEKWQQMWEETTEVAQWTKKLIPNIKKWVKCKHRELDYCTTQFLTGHGSYSIYTKRIGKSETDVCRYCGETDTVGHTIFACQRWERYRVDAEIRMGVRLNEDNIIKEMISSPQKWKIAQGMVKTIMTYKEAEERQAQRR